MSGCIDIGVRSFGTLLAPRGEALPEELNPHRRFRKVGRFIKLALAGAEDAVRRSGLTLPTERSAILLGTGLGNLPDVVGFANVAFNQTDALPSPIQFAHSLGNSAAFYVAQAFGLVGPVLALSQDEVSFEVGLLNAQLLLESGAVDFALVGGADVFLPPAADQRVRMGLSADDPTEVGEGSAWLLLERLGPSSIARLDAAWVGEAGRESAPLAGATHLAQNLWAARKAPPPELVQLPRVDSGCAAYLTESGALACAFLRESSPGEVLVACTACRDGLEGGFRITRLGGTS